MPNSHTAMFALLAATSIACGPAGSKTPADNSDNSQTPNSVQNGSTDNGSTDNGSTDNGDPDNGSTDNGSTDNGDPDNSITRQQSLYESGDRYKARVLKPPTGAQAFRGWHDADLDVPCTLVEQMDAIRCVPQTVWLVNENAWSSSGDSVANRALFGDAQCNQVVAVGFVDQPCTDITGDEWVQIFKRGERFVCSGVDRSPVRLVYARLEGAYSGDAWVESEAGDCTPLQRDIHSMYGVAEAVDVRDLPVWSTELID